MHNFDLEITGLEKRVHIIHVNKIVWIVGRSGV